ncbi:MAG: Integral rane sensor signal transduction histidine kinase [Pedosphaera sp.]|nr:Integral rane sensor signal transduction histidine kinase [Pedosphaera sp.]
MTAVNNLLMKFSPGPNNGYVHFADRSSKSISIWLALSLLLSVDVLSLRAVEATNTLEIQSVNVAGKSLPFRGKDSVSLGSFPKNIVFGFGPVTNASKLPLRLRYMLDGYENAWHEAGGEMSLNVWFYNSSGDQISQNNYPVHGESTGWTGSLKSSSLTHRRETMVVPPQAVRLLIVISSAGPPDTVGIYVVANPVVSKTSGSLGNVVLLQSPLENDAHLDHTSDDPPAGWIHDGTRPSMAKIVKFGQDPQIKAFAILDEDQARHGEWHNTLESAPVVTPGDSLVVEWNEMYSMGLAKTREAAYGAMPAGHYQFRVRGLDMMGMLTGSESSLNVFVPQPFWKTPWFWGLAAISITAMIVGISRYFVWHRMRREMVRLKDQRALEQERLRIAHDIHDDLGARITQISLFSAMSQENPAFPDKARANFDRVSKMSRELVSALYETVWAVNPENDNLDALGNYLRQMVTQLCEQTALRCRFHVQELPHEVQVSSQTRHNITMAVKEAVHNIIKHSKASEVTLRMAFSGGLLDVSVHDNGSGFQPSENFPGNGLSNMKRRLKNIGGSCFVESKPDHGTTIRMSLRVRKSISGS